MKTEVMNYERITHDLFVAVCKGRRIIVGKEKIAGRRKRVWVARCGDFHFQARDYAPTRSAAVEGLLAVMGIAYRQAPTAFEKSLQNVF